MDLASILYAGAGILIGILGKILHAHGGIPVTPLPVPAPTPAPTPVPLPVPADPGLPAGLDPSLAALFKLFLQLFEKKKEAQHIEAMKPMLRELLADDLKK